MSETSLRRQLKGLGKYGGELGSNPESRHSDYREGHELVERPISTGLLGPEINGVSHWPELANAIKKIEELVKQGQLTWEEVYVLFKQILTQLKNNCESTPEKTQSRFYQALERIKNRITEIINQLLEKTFGGLRYLIKSKRFRQVVLSIAVLTLWFKLTAPVFAESPNSAYPSEVVYKPEVTYPIDIDSDRTFRDAYNSNFSHFNEIGIEAYDVGTGDLEVDKGPFDFDQALKKLEEKLESNPKLLIEIVLDIIKLVDKNDPRPPSTSLVSLTIKTINGNKEIHGPFSQGVFVLQNDVLVPFANSGNILQEIAYTAGITYFQPTYIHEGSGQFLSGGSTVFDGHCCGRSNEFKVFEDLQSLKPGDEIIITVNTDPGIQQPGNEITVGVNTGPGIQKDNSFRVIAARAVPKEYSSDMFSSDSETINKLFARVALGLEINDENQNWERALSKEQQQELLKLVENHINGRYIFLRTCDPNLLVRGPNGLTSEGRIVVIAEAQGETGLIRPNLVIPRIKGGEIDISDEGKKQLIQLIRALYEQYPKIVQQILQEKLEESVTPSPSSQPLTSANPQSTQTPPSIPTSYSYSNSDSNSGQPSSLTQQEVGSFGEITEAVKSLNYNLNNSGLAEILPIIPFHSDMKTVDIQALTNKIENPKSELSLVRLVEHFLLNQHHLELLRDYIQVLEQLAVEAPDGDYKQDLNDFANKLRLVELIASWSLPAGGITITGSIILPLLFFLRRQKQKSS